MADTTSQPDIDALVAEKHSGLIESHKKALEQLSALRKKIPEDFDPAELTTLRDLKAKQEEAEAVRRGEFDKLTEKQKQAHAAELEKRSNREKQLTSVIERNLLSNAALHAINAEDGITKVLLPHVTSRLRMVESSDGEFAVEVLDDEGLPMKGKSIADLVRLMKADKDYATCFRSQQKGGTGSQAGSDINTSNTSNPWKTGPSFNMTQQGQLEKSNPEQAMRLKREAGIIR